jgi:FKBP-type peptidyl-prolyl cis-trans isomerase
MRLQPWHLLLGALLAACGPKRATLPLPAAPHVVPKQLDAPPQTALVTGSGLAFLVLEKGGGGSTPSAVATVTVDYTGWTADGVKFDSTFDRGVPASFSLSSVIAGWTEGLQYMAPGDVVRFWIPEELAYKGRPGAPQGMLIFDVALLSFTEPTAPPAVPVHVAAAPPEATTTASGLSFLPVERGGGGPTPDEHSTVTVQYTGWTSDGQMFDSTVTRQRPATFPLSRVISGWTEGLQHMSQGDTFLFWIPAELAYQGRPGTPQGMLVFQVELLAFENMRQAPEVPPSVAAAPPHAIRTPSGLAYVVLSEGEGGRKPAAHDTVEVHYTGWTTDGMMFDSSVQRGRAATFPLNRVIAGWTEGLQLMSGGDSYRFWIPVELAYKNQPGKPAGMLVFDVELIRVVER